MIGIDQNPRIDQNPSIDQTPSRPLILYVISSEFNNNTKLTINMIEFNKL